MAEDSVCIRSAKQKQIKNSQQSLQKDSFTDDRGVKSSKDRYSKQLEGVKQIIASPPPPENGKILHVKANGWAIGVVAIDILTLSNTASCPKIGYNLLVTWHFLLEATQNI